jgi:regulator of sigma E protease
VGTAEMSVDVATNNAYGSELEVLASRGIYETMAVHEAKPFPRIWFFSAGAIANFIFAFLVFVFVGMLGIPKEVGGRVGFISVPEDSVLTDIGFQAGDVIETIDGRFFANSDDLFDQLRASIGRPVELEITRTETEPVEQFTLEITPSDQLVALLTQARDFVLIENVDPDSPAEVAGLKAGDLIGGINGHTLNNVSDPVMRLVDTTTEFAGKTLTLTIFRDGNEQEIDVVPRENPPQGQGRIGIGILPETGTPDRSFVYLDGVQRENVSQPPGAAIQYGFERIGEIFRTIAEFPARLISGSTEPEERRVVSAVGISQLGGAILQDSIEENEPVTIIEFVALISIALGFTNLLPIPALDGGRILFVLVELVRGKPIAPEREGLVHLVGLIFMLSVGVIFIINDLVNPFTNIIP